MTGADFFETLYSSADGLIELRALPSRKRIFLDPADFEGVCAFCQVHKDQNLYFGVATRRDSSNGTKANLASVPAVWVDCDYKDVSRDKLKKAFERFPFRPSAIVTTGGGAHFYFCLDPPGTPSDIPAVEDINRRIVATLGGDLNVCDAARILRIPLTLNHKYSPPRPVTLTQLNDFRYELTDFDILPEVEHRAASNGGDFKSVKNTLLRCDFVRWCKDHPAKVSEPLWYALLSNLASMRPGGVTLCHELSKGHPDYSRKETDTKILHALDSSKPHTCEWIKGNGYKCEKQCGIRSPAALVFDEPGDQENVKRIAFRVA